LIRAVSETAASRRQDSQKRGRAVLEREAGDANDGGHAWQRQTPEMGPEGQSGRPGPVANAGPEPDTDDDIVEVILVIEASDPGRIGRAGGGERRQQGPECNDEP